MRLLRSKQARKSLAFYKLAYGLRPPYTVVVDGNFVHHALKVKTCIKARLKKLIGDVKLAVTEATLDELETLNLREALEFARTHCDRLPGSVLPDALLRVGVIVATQDRALKRQLHAMPGAATVSFNGTVLVLDPPSRASVRFAAKKERDKSRPDDKERALATRLRPKTTVVVRSKKRPAAPNPLSCKKKKSVR